MSQTLSHRDRRSRKRCGLVIQHTLPSHVMRLRRRLMMAI
jgi:hypothetical protein